MSYSALSHGGVARVSTMVVDAPLDMGGFGIRADRIEESTAGAGTEMLHMATHTKFSLVASDEVRAHDDQEYDTLLTAYGLLVETTIPDRFTETGTARIKFTGRHAYPSPKFLKLKIYVNDVAVGTERTITNTTATFTEDVAVIAGDKVQLYGYISDPGYRGYYSLFSLSADDVYTNTQPGAVW